MTGAGIGLGRSLPPSNGEDSNHIQICDAHDETVQGSQVAERPPVVVNIRDMKPDDVVIVCEI